MALVPTRRRRRVDLAYVKTADGFEVDFLARYPGAGEELIQVCAALSDPETRARELRGLQKAKRAKPRHPHR
jgi:predicted AAA+ superfamily ATPase